MLVLLHELAADKVAMVTALNLAQRNATIGDKFASRVGQKGIRSQKWPLVNMPFSESGIVPDIITLTAFPLA